MSKVFLYILLILSGLTQLHAETDVYVSAKSYIERRDYAAAARLYESVIQKEATSASYYNLGVCHGLMEQPAKAILSYERALILSPTHDKARHNLRLLYAQVEGGLSDGHALPFLDDVAYAFSSASLSLFSLIVFSLLIALFIVFRLGATVALRRAAFYTAVALFFVWIGTNALIAHQWYYYRVAHQRMIVQREVELMPTSSGDGSPILVLHPGSVLFSLPNTDESAMLNVKLADGRTGWVKAETVERVATHSLTRPTVQ